MKPILLILTPYVSLKMLQVWGPEELLVALIMNMYTNDCCKNFTYAQAPCSQDSDSKYSAPKNISSAGYGIHSAKKSDRIKHIIFAMIMRDDCRIRMLGVIRYVTAPKLTV